MKGILWFSALLAVATYIVGPIQDPDLWWHITVGRWILAHGEIPHADMWGAFSSGTPWRAYSWSNEIVYALADRAGGIHGLLSIKILLAVLIAVGVTTALSRISGSYFLGIFLGSFCTLAAFNHFTLRPQSLIWPVFALVIALADDVARKGFSRNRALLLALLFSVWANTHLSAALGLGVAVAWAASSNGHPTRERLTRALLTALACGAGTLITPYAGGEWLTFFSKTSHPFTFQSIAEFQPATILQYSTAFLVLAGAFLAALYSHARIKPSPLLLIVVTGFTLGALAVIKFLPMAVIVIAALSARVWAENRAAKTGGELPLGHVGEAITRLESAIHKVPREGLSFVFICLAILNCYKVWMSPLAYEVTPVQAVDFIQEKKLPFPLLNIFGHGGYLMYRLSDEKGELTHKVSIDGRTNLIPPHVWKAYMSAYRGLRNWREYFDLVSPQTVLWRTDSPLPTILIESGEWCLVHESGPSEPKLADRRVVVFLKRSAWETRELSSVNCKRASESLDSEG